MNSKFRPGNPENEFRLQCECQVFRNGVKVSLKIDKGSKKILKFKYDGKDHLIEILNAADLKPLFIFPINRIRKIINTFANEGKLTIEFEDPSNNKTKGAGMDMSLSQPYNEKVILLMINNCIQENLEIFLKKLEEFTKKINYKGKSFENLVLRPNFKRTPEEQSEFRTIKRLNIEDGSIKSFLFKIPLMSIKKILAYLEENEKDKFMFLCKKSSKILFELRPSVNFSNKIIPPASFAKILGKCYSLIKFQSGALKQISPPSFLIDTLRNNYNNLQELDLRLYRKMIDNSLFEISTKFTNLKVLRLNYFSNITSNGIEQMLRKMKSLRKFELDGQNDYPIEIKSHIQMNKTLLETIFLGNLISFKCHMIDQRFTLLLDKLESPLNSLSKLKISNLIYGPKTFLIFSQMNLKTFKLERIFDTFNKPILSIPIEDFEICFTKWKDLKSISLGNYCNDKIVYKIANLCKSLQKIILKSEMVSDFSISALFKSSIPIVKIDVHCCNLDGPCFEDIFESSKILHLEVSFDEYKLKCLKGILENYQLNHIKVINWKYELK